MISFQNFFVWSLLLIVHSWNFSSLQKNPLWLQCICCTVPTTSGRPHGSPFVWACQWPSSQPLSSPQLSHNHSLCGIVTLTLWPINSGVLTSLLLPRLSSSLTDFLPSLTLLCHSKTHARFMQHGPKTVWSIPYVSVTLLPSLKQNFIVYYSSKVSSHPDCIFQIHQLWQSDFCRVYSNSCCSCSLKSEILKIGQSSHKMYSNNVVNFQESTTIINAHTKKVWKLIVCTSYIAWETAVQSQVESYQRLKHATWFFLA